MRKLLMRKFGVRQSQHGQTTAEYAIIVSLIAMCSVGLVLMFGNQIRAVFAASSKRISQDQAQTVEDVSSNADDLVHGSTKDIK